MSTPRTIIVTGSAGLIGSETVRRFASDGVRVIGIDNDMRAEFFGAEASTKKTREDLIANVRGYEHHDLDIRDASTVTADADGGCSPRLHQGRRRPERARTVSDATRGAVEGRLKSGSAGRR